MKRGKRDVRALSFELSKMSPQVGLAVPWYSFLALSEIFNHSNTCAVPSVCNAVGLLVLLKLCPVFKFTFPQQLMTKQNVSHVHIHLFSSVLYRRRRVSPRQPESLECLSHTEVNSEFADSKIVLLCRALRICVAHAPTESCPFCLLVN